MQKCLLFKNAKISFSDEGKGTTVVLIHGFLENATMWNAIKPELLKRNRIITLDLIGHGNSDCLGYVTPMELFAASVEAILKHLRIRKCILIGHSLGGYVALAFAEKNSKKVKGLCLMNSTTAADDDERKILRTRANKLVKTNFNNMVRMSFTNLFGPESKVNHQKEIKKALLEALKTPLQGYIAAQEGMKTRPDRSNVLTHNIFKKLFIIGEMDPVLNYKEALMEAKKTNSEYVVFPNGHMSHIENKKLLTLTLSEFIKSC